MIPPGIKKLPVEAALRKIDQNGTLTERMATKFELVLGGRRYSPKYVLGLAAKFATGSELDSSQFSGGAETNDVPIRVQNLGIGGRFSPSKPAGDRRAVTRAAKDFGGKTEKWVVEDLADATRSLQLLKSF